MLSLQTGAGERLCRLSLQAREEGYVVHVARGRRGTVLQTEAKTPEPVAYECARRIFAALLSKKTALGYVLKPAVLPAGPVVRSRLRVLRPTPLDVAEAGALIADPDWWMQESYVGRHIVISKMGDTIHAADDDVAVVEMPQVVTDAVARIPFRCVLEGVLGEAMFTAFDLPQFETILYRSLPYDVRLGGLRSLFPDANPHLTVAATAMEFAAKVELLQDLRTTGKAGFVLKRKNGVADRDHAAGRPALCQCLFAEG